uniref:Uncharacterized protein n=1 Tax=Amphimedon queenslandica TaxID=400682 RepID=A0A1X7UT32_AMPQE
MTAYLFMIFGGYQFYVSSYKSLLKHRSASMDVLIIALAITIAFVYSAPIQCIADKI